jgi:uncharacterized protein (TIGR02246 family)
MNEIILRTVLFTMLLSYTGTARCQNSKNNNTKSAIYMNTEKQAIENLLLSYNNAINKSDTTELLSLFSEDGMLMPQKAPIAKGQEQLKAAYTFLFDTFQLNVTFSIAEIIISGNYAFAQTSSKGTSVMQSTRQTAPIENKELFTLQKVNGSWKILKYIFNQNK